MDTPGVVHSPAARLTVGGLELVYDTFGDPSAPPVLLVYGMGGQMIAWDETFCSLLAGRGFWVIRYDHRDTGLATKFDQAGVPDLLDLYQAVVHGDEVRIPYSLEDLAQDALGLLDALGVGAAHLVGLSMGGMIGQLLALRHPQRIQTLTSIMSASGIGTIPFPEAEALALFLESTPLDRKAYIDKAVRSKQILAGPAYPPDEARVRARAAKAFDRSYYPAGSARHLAAVIGTPDWVGELSAVFTPTLVIHGDADPLIAPQGGIRTAEAIPGASLVLIEGMGHDIPPPLWPQLLDSISSFIINSLEKNAQNWLK